MKSFYTKWAFYIFFMFFTIGFFIGVSNIELYNIPTVSINKNISIDFNSIITITSKNILLAITLLFGFLTANILNYILMFYNGIVFGLSFYTYSKILDNEKLLMIVLPHAILEITWMLLISSFSVKLFFSFIKFINSRYEEKEFIFLLKSKMLHKLFAIVVLAIGIELFVTPLLFNLINS